MSQLTGPAAPRVDLRALADGVAVPPPAALLLARLGCGRGDGRGGGGGGTRLALRVDGQHGGGRGVAGRLRAPRVVGDSGGGHHRLGAGSGRVSPRAGGARRALRGAEQRAVGEDGYTCRP